jgi:hypothetical protein
MTQQSKGITNTMPRGMKSFRGKASQPLATGLTPCQEGEEEVPITKTITMLPDEMV